MSLKLALFDCDGTMVDSQADICRAMEIAFERHGLPAPDHHRTRRVVGLSLVEAMRAMLPDADDGLHRALAADYKSGFQELRRAGQVMEPLYEGLADLVRRLDSEGWLLGVATGKSDRGLALCLEQHGLTRHFVTLQTADRHPSKPHPAMVHSALAEAGVAAEQAVMIGDTSFDMELAMNAGVAAIGVDWGYHEPHELLASGAACVVSTMEELHAALQAQLP